MVTVSVSHPKSFFDVLAYKNSPTPPMYYGSAHLPTCRVHRSLPSGKAKARGSPVMASVDGKAWAIFEHLPGTLSV